MRTEKNIGTKRCVLYGGGDPEAFLIQAAEQRNANALDREMEMIRTSFPGTAFGAAVFLVEDWNGELAPWKAPAVFGRKGFGDGAADTLAYVTEELLPAVEQEYGIRQERKYYLGGYSLAGLFALWASCQTDLFAGIAAVSPSVWFPGWDRYMETHALRAPKVYLSLGDREEKTKNRIMAKVGCNLRRQYEILAENPGVEACVLERNPGNHFTDVEVRMAKGFSWLLEA